MAYDNCPLVFHPGVSAEEIAEQWEFEELGPPEAELEDFLTEETLEMLLEPPEPFQVRCPLGR